MWGVRKITVWADLKGRRRWQRGQRGSKVDGVGGEEEAGRGGGVAGRSGSGTTVALGGALELVPLLFVGVLVATEDLGVCLIVAEFFFYFVIRAGAANSGQSLAAAD